MLWEAVLLSLTLRDPFFTILHLLTLLPTTPRIALLALALALHPPLALAAAILVLAPSSDNFAINLNYTCIAYFSLDFWAGTPRLSSLIFACTLTSAASLRVSKYGPLLVPLPFFIYCLFTKMHFQIFQGEWLLQIGVCLAISLLQSILFNKVAAMKVKAVALRKLFHLPSFAVIGAGMYFAPQLLQIQFAGLYFLLQQLQWARQFNYFPFLQKFYQTMQPALDQRDSKQWFTHLSLVLGVGYPIFRRLGPQLMFSGAIASLADGAAAIVGSEFGTIKLPKNQRKSVQGTLAFVLVFVGGGWLAGRRDIFGLFVGGLLCGGVEGYSKQVDNLLVPMIGAEWGRLKW